MNVASPADPQRIQELEARVAALEVKLNYDDLTGAFTRQYLFNQFSKASSAGKYFIFVDLDDFKSVNDYYGHTAGDQLLKSIAQTMMQVVGDQGFVVRFAGDEFAILLNPMSVDSFTQTEGAIRRAVGTTTLHIGSMKVTRTATFGFVKIEPDMDIQEAMTLADHALIGAKLSGKNRSLGIQHKGKPGSPRHPSVDAVRHALQEDEIGYHVQPILRCHDLETVGYEALLRWSMPSGEVLGPSQFLETMTKAYNDITRPPLSAARQTSEWATVTRSKFISFNISEAFIARIVNEGLGWVDEIIGDVPNDMIVFELLETVVNRQEDYVAEAISKLRQRGIRVALDDFGIGYSNLERLQGTDVDFVKIDKQLIHGAVNGQRGLDVLACMVDLSHRLSAQTVIEGIENAEHLSVAHQVGATFVQGYYLGRPKPIQDY